MALLLQAVLSVLHDRGGHRCFLVPNEDAVTALGRVFAEHGLRERFTFDAGETTQTLFDDNATVLMQINDEALRYKLELTTAFYAEISDNVVGPGAVSFLARNPRDAAERACGILNEANFEARLNSRFMSELGEKFAIVESAACWGWSLCFRRHAAMMGRPKNVRQIINLDAAGA